MSETRVFPTCCTSAYCGKLKCPADCRNLSTLEDFKKWKEETAAECADPVWCPSVYTATRPRP